MNKLKSLFLGLGLALTGALGSSCGIMGSEESLFIDSILASPQADGSTIITITFTDDDIKPVTFTIPAGQDGEQGPRGTGIASVSSKVSEDGKDLVITMTYSDTSLAPSSWTIPNATSITDIESAYDEESGMTTVTITTNDGEAHEFELPKGRDGNGVASVTQTTDENKNIIITINYTDPSFEPTVITLPYRNGEDGNGIQSIVGGVSTDGESYYLLITYTNEETQEIELPMPPAGTQWFRGDEAPGFVSGARDGDYYFCTGNNTIYVYRYLSWEIVVQLKKDNCSVTFDASTNGGRITGTNDASVIRSVPYGENIVNIPQAYRTDGALFLGWFTASSGAGATIGQFTDLTAVTRDLHLYACFQEVGS